MDVLAAGSGSSLFFPKVYDLIWSSVVLIVLLIVFAKYIMPKFNKAMDERARQIKGQIDNATAMRKDAEAMRKKYASLLDSAKQEAEKIRQDAKAKAGHIIEEAELQAKQEAEKIRQDAKANLESQKNKALSDLSEEVGALAASLASKILGKELENPDCQSSMASSAIRQMESSEGK